MRLIAHVVFVNHLIISISVSIRNGSKISGSKRGYPVIEILRKLHALRATIMHRVINAAAVSQIVVFITALI